MTRAKSPSENTSSIIRSCGGCWHREKWYRGRHGIGDRRRLSRASALSIFLPSLNLIPKYHRDLAEFLRIPVSKPNKTSVNRMKTDTLYGLCLWVLSCIRDMSLGYFP